MRHAELIDGDLLEADDDYIVHQCNCMTKSAAGIARVIFDKFPWANVYAERKDLKPPLIGQMPGNIDIRGDGKDCRLVIALFGQFYGGGPAVSPRQLDHFFARRQMFDRGLELILQKVPEDGTVAFPWQIGCGLAGGDWEGWYEPRLDQFAQHARLKGIKTRIYRLQDV
jgi:O-acetyl-ADP-ribose deacetylase (regulator of RNase III)